MKAESTGRSWVKFVAQCLRDLNRYSTGCNAHSHRHKARMSVSPAQHGPDSASNKQATSLTARLG